MKGIILAGGKGTRLYPLTKSISKQILPVYDKPMIYYPLSVLLLSGIKEVMIISSSDHIELFKNLFGDGDNLGISFTYKIQSKPKGLADAFIIAEDFIGNDNVCLILGDNIFYGQMFSPLLKESIDELEGASIFGYPVKNPEDFGVVEFDSDYNVLSIEEKPILPKSKYAVPGLYFYDNSVVEKAKKVKPSSRGEIEITAVNNMYLEEDNLKVKLLGRGMAWFDTGSADGLMNASEFIRTIQARQGFYVSCIEEIAWRRGFIDSKRLNEIGESMKDTEYGKYLIELSKGEI